MQHINVEKRRKRQALWKRNNNLLLRNKCLKILGKVCVKCGFTDERALTIDHINGGGCKERTTKGGSYYSFLFKKLSKGNKDYQLLCANCNQIKKVENNETHKKY